MALALSGLTTAFIDFFLQNGCSIAPKCLHVTDNEIVVLIAKVKEKKLIFSAGTVISFCQRNGPNLWTTS